MHSHQHKNALLHVLLPLAGGLIIYLSGPVFAWPSLIKNYLPDACWSYALFSSILLVWDRTIQYAWLLAAAGLLLLTEGLQGTGAISGTADGLDLLAYGIAAALAIWVNQRLVNYSKNRLHV